MRRGSLVPVVGIQGGKPDPEVEVVAVGDGRDRGHHVDLGEREVVGVRGVVGPGRDDLDGIGAEQGQLAEVLFPFGDGPAGVGVGLRAVADLMPAQRIVGRGDHRSAGQQRVGQQYRRAADFQVAQQPTHPVQHAAGVVAGDAKRSAVAFDAESLRPRGELGGAKRLRLLRRPARAGPHRGGGVAQQDHRTGAARRRPRLLCAAGDLFGQHGPRLAAARRALRRNFDPGLRQIHARLLPRRIPKHETGAPVECLRRAGWGWRQGGANWPKW